MNNHRFPVPLIPVTGKVLNGSNGPVLFGDLYDLAGSISVGLYDAETNAIATTSGNGKVFYIGYSSEHTKDFLDKWFFGMQLPKGNPFWQFRGEDVISFEYSDPAKAKAEKWVLGYDGSAGCNNPIPAFECGKVYGVQILASGSPVFRRWAKVLEHQIFTDPICCSDDDCTTGCIDNKVNPLRVVKDIAYRINNHVELKQIGVKARYLSNQYTPTTPNMNVYDLSVTDDGSATAQALVQITVGSVAKVTRKSRFGQLSVYEVCAPASPAAYQPPSSYAVSTCGVCPAGTTTQSAYDAYVVVRPLTGAEDFTSDASKLAYATAVGTAYETLGAKSFNAATGVNTGTDTITVTGHGFNTGDSATYNNGGGTSVTGLTSGTSYFVIAVTANTIKLATTRANAVAGTAIDLTAAGTGTQTLAPVDGQAFLSSNGSTAQVEVRVPVGATVVATGADTVVFSRSVEAQCIVTAPATIAWVSVGTAYRGVRNLCVTLERKDCSGADRLAELTALYGTNPMVVAGSIVKVTGDGCRDTYTMQQYSDGCMLDGCLSYDTSNFTDLAGLDGQVWKEVEPTPAAYDATLKVGLEITAELPEKYFSDCAYEINDFYENEPIRLEVSWIIDSYTGFPDNCSMGAIPSSRRVTPGVVARQSGEWVLREYLKFSGAYEAFAMDSNTPRMREITDSNKRKQIDRSASYKVYYLQFNVHRKAYNFGQAPETVEAQFFFKEGDPNMFAFEAAFGGPLSKFGTVLKERK